MPNYYPEIPGCLLFFHRSAYRFWIRETDTRMNIRISKPPIPEHSSLSGYPAHNLPAFPQSHFQAGSCRYQNLPQYSMDYLSDVLFLCVFLASDSLYHILQPESQTGKSAFHPGLYNILSTVPESLKTPDYLQHSPLHQST